jgi:hypothetical protein
MMWKKDKKDILFFLYILIVLVLAVIYFTMPERAEFFEFQLKWWGEMWRVIRGG